MRPVNLYYFFQIGSILHPLNSAQESERLGDIMYAVYSARDWLDHLLRGSVVPLPVTWASGQALLQTLNEIIAESLKPSPSPDISALDEPVNYEPVLSTHAYNLRLQTQKFENVLQEELRSLDTYFISQKGIYSTPDLIDTADRALEIEIRAELSPETIRDFQQAGRCLALELPTASGYHIMRATEAILRQWHILEVPPPPTPRTGFLNWNQCVEELKTANADTNTLAVLDQIRKLHRNPLMHPEIFLTVPESLRLFDIAKSAIVAMVEQIIAKKATMQPMLPAIVASPSVP